MSATHCHYCKVNIFSPSGCTARTLLKFINLYPYRASLHHSSISIPTKQVYTIHQSLSPQSKSTPFINLYPTKQVHTIHQSLSPQSKSTPFINLYPHKASQYTIHQSLSPQSKSTPFINLYPQKAILSNVLKVCIVFSKLLVKGNLLWY